MDRAHAQTNGREARSPSDRPPQADRLDYDKGVSGRLLEVGYGTYRNRPDAEPSTYVALELDNGRRHQVWGVGLEKDVADSGGKPGDRILMRRESVEPVIRAIKFIDAATGFGGIERRQMWRNKWSVTVEARHADRPAAAHDSDQLAAQSQLVVINRLVERALPNDESARQSIMAFAKERIAHHRENGRSFARATILEADQERQRPETHKDQARHDGQLRMKARER